MLSETRHAWIRREGVRIPLENDKVIGFLSNTDPDPPENHNATKPTFYDEPLFARQRNAILKAFCSRANNDMFSGKWTLSLSSSTKNKVELDPL